MSSKSDLLDQQRAWALSHGIEPDERGYLANVDLNLLQPMTVRARHAFEHGSGSELMDTAARPAKMRALHSSSALAVNFFDFWIENDNSALRQALQLEDEISNIEFEAQYPTGLTGNPPNLDVTLELSKGYVIGIESKFSEWLTPKSKGKAPLFKPKYFPSGQGLWEDKGLPDSQRLVEQIRSGDAQFKYLDAPQLLKHSLGLANKLGDQFSLYYVYLDWPGKESIFHSDEISQFGELLGEELRFVAMTYQELLSSIRKQPDADRAYLSYLETRYCSFSL